MGGYKNFMKKLRGLLEEQGYAKYAVLNYINPIVSIIYGFTGFTMEKMTDEEYEKMLEARAAEAEAMKKELEA